MRYIIGFLVTIGLIIVVLILIFHGGSSNQPQTTAPPLSQYVNTSTEVQFTIDGPINDPQDHRQVRVTVGNNQIYAALLQGYQGQVLRSSTTPNDPTSYAAFLHSLQLAGFTKGDTSGSVRDERGYCPQGDRYVYQIFTPGQADKERFWYTECNQGSYKGNAQLTNDLFRAQVPQYDTLIGNIFL